MIMQIEKAAESLTDHVACNIGGVVDQRTAIAFDVNTAEIYDEGPTLDPVWEDEEIISVEIVSARCLDHDVVLDV